MAETVHHYGLFETIRRVRDGEVLWLATCGCGQSWTEPDYESAHEQWRKHWNAEKESAMSFQPYCDKPDDCPNGPGIHEFVPPADDLRVCPCARQDWEKETPQ